MIIKMSFGDSDLVYYLAEFCERLTWRMFSEYDIEYPDLEKGNLEENAKRITEVIKKRKEMNEKKVKLLSPENHFKKGSDEQKEIIKEVLRLWDIYAKEHNVSHTPTVSIQYALKEHWENGESLYYFSAVDSVIVL